MLMVALWLVCATALCDDAQTYQIDCTEQLVLQAFPLMMDQLAALISSPRNTEKVGEQLSGVIDIVAHLAIDLTQNNGSRMTHDQKIHAFACIEQALNNALCLIKAAQVSL